MRSLAGLLWLGLALLWAGPAMAHAALVESHPADGVVLETAPARFELRFNEPVAPLVLKLVSADGTAVVLERHHRDGTRLIIEAPAIGDGSHALSWRVVSEDGHPIGGSILFSVGAPSAGPPAAEAPGDRGVAMALWSAKLALYLGLFIGIGGVCFGTFVASLPDGARISCKLALTAGLVAAALSIGLQGLDALGTPLREIAGAAAWQAGFATSYGVTALVGAYAMAAALAGLFVAAGFVRQLLVLTALIGCGAALAASGHASAAAPQMLTRPAVFLHAVGIALWIGALPPLGLMLRQKRADAAAALARFSRAIPVVLVPLVVAGLALAVVQLGRPSALWSTDYGRLFMAKLALLALLFGLAAMNRWRLTRPARLGEPVATRRLARSIAVEIALAIAIFGVTAAWRFTPPPRSLDLARERPAAIHLHSDRGMAHLTLAPARAGPVDASMILVMPDGRPLAAKEVTLMLSNPAAGIEPIRRPAVRVGDNAWRVEGLVLPVAGRWAIRLDVLVSDFEKLRLEQEVQIGG